ncbi:MAG: hypothetical protein AB7D08_08845 [Bacteroidales bacterium]
MDFLISICTIYILAPLTEYEEDYVRTLLEKITVYDDHFIIEFKSGIEIQIDE